MRGGGSGRNWLHTTLSRKTFPSGSTHLMPNAQLPTLQWHKLNIFYTLVYLNLTQTQQGLSWLYHITDMHAHNRFIDWCVLEIPLSFLPPSFRASQEKHTCTSLPQHTSCSQCFCISDPFRVRITSKTYQRCYQQFHSWSTPSFRIPKKLPIRERKSSCKRNSEDCGRIKENSSFIQKCYY